MSFDINEAFATDETLENEGAIFPLGKGSSLLIARSGNRAYTKALTKEVERRKVELDDVDEAAAGKVSDEIMINVMARTILLGWTKVTVNGVVDMPYSTENASIALGMKEFRKFVAGKADSMESFRIKTEVKSGNA